MLSAEDARERSVTGRGSGGGSQPLWQSACSKPRLERGTLLSAEAAREHNVMGSSSCGGSQPLWQKASSEPRLERWTVLSAAAVREHSGGQQQLRRRPAAER